LCRKSNIEYITLEPANNNLKSYYLQCGFEEKHDIAGNNFLVLDVNNKRIITKNNSKIRIKTHKQRRHTLNNYNK
jgi:hypothetical protein